MSKPAIYRARPVEVTAMRVGKPYKEVAEWSGGGLIFAANGKTVKGLVMEEVVGRKFAYVGDWIVKGQSILNGKWFLTIRIMSDEEFHAIYDSVQ